MSPQSTVHSSQIVVVGGGIAGLVAANQAARRGHAVTLVEKGAALGGRAATRERQGFSFNLGPHALYRAGVLRQTLRTFGIDPPGAVPGANGGFAIYQGRPHTLPAGFASLMTTGLLRLPEKFEFAKLLSSLAMMDAAAIQHETLAAWLARRIQHERVRDVIKMLVRVATFTNDPGHQSAGAAIEQLQLAVKANVLYVDGGWQTIVDALRDAATRAGVRITTGTAVSLDARSSHQAAPERCATARGVRLADGSSLPASAVILTGAPADVDGIAGTSFAATLPPPVRVATLDIGLRTLPRPKRLVAFGVDAPTYFSVHSAVAKLTADGGAVLHVARYLPPDEGAGRDVERQLEAVVDDLQPGWRDTIETKQFLPNLVVTHAEVTAAQGGVSGRPSPRVDLYDNVFVAGDWIGARGQLSDAAAASGMAAADAAAS
jgi:phytoene dehydrogenase-like protein